jgi:hypothetical protein
MNDRWGKPPYPEKPLLTCFAESGITATIQKPGYEIVMPEKSMPPVPPLVKSPARTNNRKGHTLHKDLRFTIKRGEIFHVISENYSYKTDSYYTILQMEMEGKRVEPSTATAIDAFVVPICLERAKLASISVCDWEISQGYVPLPCIIYGLNYFACTSEFFVVYDNEMAKEAIRHLTNNGKYPFCYQKLGENAEIFQCTAIFGRTVGQDNAVAHIAEKIYEHFSIPLVRMVYVKNKNDYALSSLSPARYSQLTEDERALLEAYISHQEFL